MILEWFQIGLRVVPEWSQSGPRVVPDVPKMSLRCHERINRLKENLKKWVLLILNK